MVRPLALWLFALTFQACEEKKNVPDPLSYVAVGDLSRTLPEPRSGQSRTPAVPTLHHGRPSYLKFLHGFRAPTASSPVTVDTPSEIWVIDARSGRISEELRVTGAHAVFPAANLDDNALAQLGPLHDKLAPAFFDGAPRVPPDLEPAAATYREIFPKAIQPEYIPIYREHAADWFRWVGL